MTDRRRGPYSTDPSQQPVLTRLERPGGRSGAGWRIAAGALTVLLVGVVVAGRLGMEDVAPAASPTSSPAAVASPSASPAAEPTIGPAQPTPSSPWSPDGSVPITDALPDVARHLDGIPTSIGGEKVYRLTSALDRGGDRAILVGGWYVGPDCLRVGRCVGRLAESPATAARSTHSVALTGLVEPGTGPRVLRASLREECWTVADPSNCMPVLSVVEVVWKGDFFTQTAPFAVQPLLSALQYAFPDMRPEPFRDFARCAIDWPPQTYRSTRGGPRMTVVFPTVEDRLAAEAQIAANWPQPADGASGQCMDHFMTVPEAAGWLSSANVMIWASEEEDVQALVQAALVDALAQSPADESVVPGPITTWAALRGLRRWDAALDVLPQHDYMVWAVDLPADAYALSDPLVRVLLVFPTPADRRAYQQNVDVSEVSVLVSLRATQGGVGDGLRMLRDADLRWLGYRNVLLLVSGPAGFDDQLREALAAELR